MKILVTGGAGFIGSHVVDAYVAEGHKVTVVDDLSTGKKVNLNPKARFVKADVGSKKLASLFKSGKFDAVNHHTAQIDVRKSVLDPTEDARVNVMGLLNILELSRQCGVKKFIFSASGGTYYGECTRPAREDDPPAPLSPYGVTKLAGEHYIRAYGALHGLKTTVLRYGNVFGPRQDPHGEAGVVAIFCNRLLSGDPVLIFGDGRQQRDYVFVMDVARASLLALTRGHGLSVNIGTGRATSVNQLFAGLSKASGVKTRPVHKPARPGELFRSCLDVSFARKALGWKPLAGLEDGLRQTFLHIQATR
jgi:UDP-glucose 4-epimerase